MIEKLSHKDFRPLCFAVIAFVCLSVIAQIIFFRPFWGLMDDWGHVIVTVPRVKEMGLFGYAWHYAMQDISWGMFRPLYPIMAYFIYLPGVLTEPTASYLVNSGFALAAIYCSSSAIARAAKVPLYQVLIVAATQPHLYDLFQHPSLQEKLVHLAGAALLFVMMGSVYSAPFYALAILISVLGGATKASFLIYLAMAGVTALAVHGIPKSARQWAQASFLGILWIGVFLALFWVSRQGNYTSSNQSLAKVLPNLLSVYGLAYALPVLLFLIVQVRAYLREPGFLVPLIGVVAYLAIFLPWGVSGYVQSIIGPAYAALIVVLARKVLAKFGSAWLVPFCVVAVFLGAYRPFGMFQRLHDLGAIVADARQMHASGVTTMLMPCEEGSLTMEQVFASVYGGHTPIKVGQIFEINSETVHDGTVLLYDTAMCPLPGRVQKTPGCDEKDIYRSRWQKSYRVVRLENCAL